MSDIGSTLGYLQGFADQAISQATNEANKAKTWDLKTPDAKFNYNFQKPSMERPPSYSSITSVGSQDISLTKYNEAADKWFQKFFPNLKSVLEQEPEQWALDILSGKKPLGNTEQAFDAAWNEGRDRANRQAATEKKQIEASYSLRGFSLPPAAMLADSRDAEMRATDEINDLNRQQTIKHAELTLELAKFAATTSVQLKESLYSLCNSFFNTIASLAAKDPSSEKMRAKAQAYSSYVSGLSNFYNVELGFEKLRLSAEETKSGVDRSNAAMKLDATSKGIDSYNTASASAAKGFADAAGAAANAQSALQAELFSGAIA